MTQNSDILLRLILENSQFLSGVGQSKETLINFQKTLQETSKIDFSQSKRNIESFIASIIESKKQITQQAAEEKNLIQERAKQLKSLAQMDISQDLKSAKTIEEKKSIQELANLEKLKIQEKAEADKRAINEKYDNEKKKLDEILKQSKVNLTEISKSEKQELDKKFLDAKKINKEITEQISVGINKISAIQKLANEKDLADKKAIDKTIEESKKRLQSKQKEISDKELQEAKIARQLLDQYEKESLERKRIKAKEIQKEINQLTEDGIKQATNAQKIHAQLIASQLTNNSVGSFKTEFFSVDKQNQSFKDLAFNLNNATTSLITFYNLLKQLSIDNSFVDTSKEYEVHLRNFNSLAQQTEEVLRKTHDSIKSLATEEQLSGMTELAKALQHIESSGFHASEGLKVLEESNRGAYSGLADLFKVTDATTSILKAYSLSAEHAREVINLSAKTVEVGKVTYDQLNASIGTAISIAPEVGVAYDEISAGLSTITAQGVSAHIAATELNAVLKGFLKPSKDSAEFAKSLGLDLSSTTLHTKGLGNAVSEIIEKTKQFGGDQKSAITRLLPDIRELRGILKLAVDDGKLYAENLAYMRDGTDQVTRALEEQKKTFSYQEKALGDMTEALKIEFGPLLQEAFIPFLKASNDLIGTFINLPEPLKKSIEVIVLLGSGIVGLAIAIGGLTIGVTGLVTAFTGLKLVLEGGVIVTYITELYGALTLFATGSTVIIGGLGAIGLAIAGIGMGAYSAYQAMKSLAEQKKFNEAEKNRNEELDSDRQRLNKFQRLHSEGKLTPEQKIEEAHLLVKVDPEKRTKAQEIAKEARFEIESKKKTENEKNKISLDSYNERVKLEKDGIENLSKYERMVFEASHSERQNKIEKTNLEFNQSKKELESVQKSNISNPEEKQRAFKILQGLEKAHRDEIAKINREYDKKEQDEKDKLDTERTKRIKDKYDAEINKSDKRINEIQSKNITDKKKLYLLNQELTLRSEIYKQESHALSFNEKLKTQALENSQKTDKEIVDNKRKITDIEISLLNERHQNSLKFLAHDAIMNSKNEQQKLNDAIAYDKKRLQELENFLKESKKIKDKLTPQNEKDLTNEIKIIKNGINETEKKLNDTLKEDFLSNIEIDKKNKQNSEQIKTEVLKQAYDEQKALDNLALNDYLVSDSKKREILKNRVNEEIKGSSEYYNALKTLHDFEYSVLTKNLELITKSGQEIQKLGETLKNSTSDSNKGFGNVLSSLGTEIIKIQSISSNVAKSMKGDVSAIIELVGQLSNEVVQTLEHINKATQNYNSGNLREAKLERTKSIPIIGGLLGTIEKTLTDSYGETIPEWVTKTNNELKILQLTLQKISLESQKQTESSELDLLYLQKKIELTQFWQKIDNEKALYDDKRITQELAIIEQKYINDANKISEKYLETKKSNNKSSLEIDYDLKQSEINLQEESFSKQLELLEFEKNKKINFLDIEYNQLLEKAEGNEEQLLQIKKDYSNKKQIIDLEYQSSYKKLIADNNSKIQELNQKNYDNELKLIESTLGKKRKALESDYDQQLDIINNYEQKKQALIDKKSQDQENKTKLKQSLDTQKAQISGTLKDSFFKPNDKQYSLNSSDIISSIISQSEDGIIGSDEKNRLLREQYAKDVLYYEKLLQASKNLSQEAKAGIRAKLTGAKSNYYGSFDQEQQALDSEKRLADKRLSILQDQIDKARFSEEEAIKSLDSVYKTSAGTFKNEMVSATDYFVKYTKQSISQIGADLFNQVQKAKLEIDSNNKEVGKLTGKTDLGIYPRAYGSGSTSLSNSTLTTVTDYNPKNNREQILKDISNFKYGTENYKSTPINDLANQNSWDVPTLKNYARILGIKGYEFGGATNGAFLVGEKESEIILNSNQGKTAYSNHTEMQKIFELISKPIESPLERIKNIMSSTPNIDPLLVEFQKHMNNIMKNQAMVINNYNSPVTITNNFQFVFNGNASNSNDQRSFADMVGNVVTQKIDQYFRDNKNRK